MQLCNSPHPPTTESLVLHHIKDCLPPTLDPHRFVYWPDRSTTDAIATTLHSALSHLEHKNNYVRLLFIDYSSAFNTIIPDILVHKLHELGIPPSFCTWFRDFLTNRPRRVKLGPHLSSTRTLSISSPQDCVLSPLLYSLYTFDCRPAHQENIIGKFADYCGLDNGGERGSLSGWSPGSIVDLYNARCNLGITSLTFCPLAGTIGRSVQGATVFGTAFIQRL